MPTTRSRRPRDRRHVELVGRCTQADASRRPVAPRRLADQRRHVRALDGAQVVDDPLRVRLGRAHLGEVAAQEVRDHEPAALVDLGALQRPRQELHLRELDALVDVLEDLVHVRARLDELRRQPQRLRGRVRVLEPPGVGDERDVERLGDVRRQLDAELAQQVADDLAGRRRVRDDEVHVAEARVVVVVIDVDDERCAVQHLRIRPEPALVRAVEREQHPVGASSGTARRRSSSGIHVYSRGSGASPVRYMTASLPSASSASFAASSDPSASPSGFSCVVTRKRSCERIASATASARRRSLSRCGAPSGAELHRSELTSSSFGPEPLVQLRHADAFRDRGIVLEGQ